jgi:hypothetical protein
VDHFGRKKISFFTYLLPVFESGRSSGEARSLKGTAGRFRVQQCSNPLEIPEFTGDKEKRDGAVEMEALCSYDAEDVENICGGVRRVGNIWMKFRLAAVNWLWCGNSFRLRLSGLADNSGRCVRLDVQEREVIRGVVGELEEFGGLKSGETAKQQSHHDEKDDFAAHFRVRQYRRVIQQMDA